MEYLQYYQVLTVVIYFQEVLNLVISGIPSILNRWRSKGNEKRVLNLVISGIPSIH